MTPCIKIQKMIHGSKYLPNSGEVLKDNERQEHKQRVTRLFKQEFSSMVREIIRRRK